MALLFHTFAVPKHWYVFDANRNSVLSVSEDEFKALSEIERGIEAPESMAVLHEFQRKGFCCEAYIETIKHPETDILETHLCRRLQGVTLQVTQRCNLRCSYCAFSGLYSHRSHGTKSMSFETAKRALDMALLRSEDSPKFYVAFYGGEPLLELSLIKRCVEYIKEKAANREIRFTMTTNGTMLTTEIYSYLIDSDFDILISLDGPKPVHDMSRKFADGSGSYDVIMKNLSDIAKQYPDSIEKIKFNAVVNPEIEDSCLPSLFNPSDVISYYNTSMKFISPLYNESDLKYSEAFYVYTAHEMCKLFLSLLGKLDRQHVSNLITEQMALINRDNDLLRTTPKIFSTCHPGGPCIPGAQRIFVDVNGRFLPCERVSERSHPMLIGDLDSGIDLEKAKKLLNVGQITEEQCKKCWVILHCSMCAAFADDLTELSKGKRLSNCENIRSQYEDTLKNHCFLKEAGYNFEK